MDSKVYMALRDLVCESHHSDYCQGCPLDGEEACDEQNPETEKQLILIFGRKRVEDKKQNSPVCAPESPQTGMEHKTGISYCTTKKKGLRDDFRAKPGKGAEPKPDTSLARHPMIYLAHPYTGDEEANKTAARAIADYIATKAPGVVVLNPLDACQAFKRHTYSEILGWTTAMMAHCDGAIFSAGWQASRGCRHEHAVADRLGLQTFDGVAEFLSAYNTEAMIMRGTGSAKKGDEKNGN